MTWTCTTTPISIDIDTGSCSQNCWTCSIYHPQPNNRFPLLTEVQRRCQCLFLMFDVESWLYLIGPSDGGRWHTDNPQEQYVGSTHPLYGGDARQPPRRRRRPTTEGSEANKICEWRVWASFISCWYLIKNALYPLGGTALHTPMRGRSASYNCFGKITNHLAVTSSPANGGGGGSWMLHWYGTGTPDIVVLASERRPITLPRHPLALLAPILVES